MTNANTQRVRVPCLDSARCGTRWHWSDTTPLCGASSRSARKSVDALVALRPPAPMLLGPDAVTPTDEGIRLEFTEETWEAFALASSAVHGLHVNRHALVSVVERVTSGGWDSSNSATDEEVLAFEILCLDEDTRLAVARAAMGPGADRDDTLEEVLAAGLADLLAHAHGAEAANEDGPTLAAFPHLRERVAGLIDASYEAQKKTHAYAAMVSEITKKMYEQHKDRVGQKWIVRGSRALPFAKGQERSGDIVINMSTKQGLYDVGVAKDNMTPEEWADALSKTRAEEIAVTPAALRAEAKRRNIPVEAFVSESTSQVDLMIAVRDEADPLGDVPFESGSKTAKADGEAEYRRGVRTFGSHFYVAPPDPDDKEKSFATLVSARARADMRRAEADGVASALKETVRKIEPLAVNMTLRYEGSKRDFVFQVNKTTSFDKEGFSSFYPEVVDAVRKNAQAADKVTPSKRAIQEALAASRGEEKSADVDTYRKPSTPRPLLKVVGEDGSQKEPSALGKHSAEGRISRGDALNGRAFLETSRV